MMGFLDPLDQTTPHVKEWQERHITTITLDQLPLDQKDDRNVLAAMSRIAGRLAVKDAIKKNKATSKNALVISTGSSGFAAIKECIANGLQTTAFGTSESRKEEIEALGATYVHMSRELSERDQRNLLLPALVETDITVTAARRAGQRAPLLINSEALDQMKPGSVIVDLALTEGGNVEGSENDRTNILGNNVIVTNNTGYPKKDPYNASKSYSCGICQLMQYFGEKYFEKGDPLFDAAFVTYKGQLNPVIFKV